MNLQIENMLFSHNVRVLRTKTIIKPGSLVKTPNIVQIEVHTWKENTKNTNAVFMRVSKKFCLVGFRNSIMFEGTEKRQVVIAHTIAKVSAGYSSFILTSKLATHQKLETLSSKIPRPIGNILCNICFTCIIKRLT